MSHDLGQNRNTAGRPKKDWWDKASVIVALIGTAAIPLLIYLFGTRLQSNIEEKLHEESLAVEQKVAEANQAYQAEDIHIRRAAFAKELLPILSAQSPKERMRGYDLALWALSEEDSYPLLTDFYVQEDDPIVKQQLQARLIKLHILQIMADQQPAVQQPTAEKNTDVVTVTKRSGMKDSGPGKDFSPPYQLCNDPLPEHAVIVAYKFYLVGDRVCSNWAACKQTVSDPKQICYSFSLQGHDELAFQNRGIAQSEGVLEVTYGMPGSGTPLTSPTIQQSTTPEWQQHLSWCRTDTGAPDCPELYTTIGAQDCLTKGIGGGTGVGNRACLLKLAKEAALGGACQIAYNMALTCQCQNAEAQQVLSAAGPDKICDFLRGMQN